MTNAKGQRICGSPKTRGRGPCQSPFLYANGRCKKHGGPAKAGIANPNFKHGRMSRVMPTALAASFEEALNDPELISHREHVAMYDARIVELLDMLGKGGGTKGAWNALQGAYAALEAIDPVKEPKAYDDALRVLGDVVSNGAAEGAVWAEIQSVGKLRRQAADSEMKRLQRMHSMISVERVVVMVQAIVSLIRENVTDATALYRIQGGLEQLMNRMSQTR